MDDIGKRDLPLSCRSNAEYLNASIALFFLNSDGRLGCLLSPEMIRLFELDLSAVNPKIDRSIRLSVKDALVKPGRFQRGSKVTGHPGKVVPGRIRER
jgi:hypothetical protein